MMKTNDKKGITLIALVITIIVLLILAGISIAMLTGNNGILTQAQKAKTNNSEAGAKEKIEVEILGSIDKTGKFNKEKFKENIKKNLNLKDEDIKENERNTIIVEIDDNSIAIDKDGNIAGINTIVEVNTDTVTQEKIENPSEITYSWQELKEIANAISSNNAIGEDTASVIVTKKGESSTLTVGDYTTVKYDNTAKKVRILGFNTDTKTDGKKAGITFEFLTILSNDRMNMINTNEGGWGATLLRNKLNSEEYLNQLEPSVKESLVEVEKQYNLGNMQESNSTNPSKDKLWLLAESEIFNSGYKEESYGYCNTFEGKQYEYYKILNLQWNLDNDALVKYNSIANTEAKWWWLRSPIYDWSIAYCGIGETGNTGGLGYAGGEYGVAPGFCI